MRGGDGYGNDSIGGGGIYKGGRQEGQMQKYVMNTCIIMNGKHGGGGSTGVGMPMTE